MISRRLMLDLCLCSPLALGCGDPLVAPELITGNRVLAARVQAAGDANRGWVLPSEAARVRWLVAGPNGPARLAWAFSACVAQTTSRGLPSCAAPAFAQTTQVVPSTAEPGFDFTMPDRASLGSNSQIAISAAGCQSGAAVVDATGVDFATAVCPDRSETPVLATVNVQAVLNGAANVNPDFGDVTVLFDDAEWPVWNENEAAVDDCLDPTLSIPHVATGSAGHELAFAVPVDMSEVLPQLSAHSAARESLSLAHFVTAGDLDRAYSDVELNVNPATARVGWIAPAAVPQGGMLVRFYLVLRDGRGGTDFVERAVCIVSQ